MDEIIKQIEELVVQGINTNLFSYQSDVKAKMDAIQQKHKDIDHFEVKPTKQLVGKRYYAIEFDSLYAVTLENKAIEVQSLIDIAEEYPNALITKIENYVNSGNSFKDIDMAVRNFMVKDLGDVLSQNKNGMYYISFPGKVKVTNPNDVLKIVRKRMPFANDLLYNQIINSVVGYKKYYIKLTDVQVLNNDNVLTVQSKFRTSVETDGGVKTTEVPINFTLDVEGYSKASLDKLGNKITEVIAKSMNDYLIDNPEYTDFETDAVVTTKDAPASLLGIVTSDDEKNKKVYDRLAKVLNSHVARPYITKIEAKEQESYINVELTNQNRESLHMLFGSNGILLLSNEGNRFLYKADSANEGNNTLKAGISNVASLLGRGAFTQLIFLAYDGRKNLPDTL